VRYLVECYLPGIGNGGRADLAARARAAARELQAEGADVRCLRAISVPSDEACLLVYEGTSMEQVRAAIVRARIEVERIVEAEDDDR